MCDKCVGHRPTQFPSSIFPDPHSHSHPKPDHIRPDHTGPTHMYGGISGDVATAAALLDVNGPRKFLWVLRTQRLSECLCVSVPVHVCVCVGTVGYIWVQLVVAAVGVGAVA